MACKDDKSCTGTLGPHFPEDGGSGVPCSPGVIPKPEGAPVCPPTSRDPNCQDFDLSDNKDPCFIEGVIGEALNIAGAKLNIYKLLGVHEQGKLVDVTGCGRSVSNGDTPLFPSEYAFDAYITEWRSIQRGDGVTASAYIGYDFGVVKTNDKSRQMYGVTAPIRNV